jgi:hypothetical protein
MSSSNPEDEIRQQLVTVFGQAEYPVVDPMELIPVLPDGAATTFEAPGVSLGAMEIGMGYSEYQDYPYDDVEALVTDLMAGLRDDDVFE